MTPTSPAIEVTLSPPARPEDLRTAAELGIPIAAAADPTKWQVRRTLGKLTLHAPGDAGGMTVSTEFGSGALANRLRTARRTDPLPRAAGLHRGGEPPRVLDATAGLCRDAAVLARLGCRVTALERVPALVMLGIEAARTTRFPGSLSVHLADASAWLAALPGDQRPEVVYLDPMFEEPGKAQVKKEMQVCRMLCGPGDSGAELLELARTVASERVVVKRHGKAAPLAPGASFAVTSERVRFDVYLTAPHDPAGSRGT